jgi:magnesium transporter
MIAAVDSSSGKSSAEIQALLPAVAQHAPNEVVTMLESYPDELVVGVLELLNPVMTQEVLARFPSARRQKLLAAAPPAVRRQWVHNETFAEDTIGRIMEVPLAIFRPEMTIADATEELRHLVKRAFITYLFVVDDEERLLGVVAMREMLLGDPRQRLDTIMIPKPFHLTSSTLLADGHFPRPRDAAHSALEQRASFRRFAPFRAGRILK